MKTSTLVNVLSYSSQSQWKLSSSRFYFEGADRMWLCLLSRASLMAVNKFSCQVKTTLTELIMTGHRAATCRGRPPFGTVWEGSGRHFHTWGSDGKDPGTKTPPKQQNKHTCHLSCRRQLTPADAYMMLTHSCHEADMLGLTRFGREMEPRRV